MPSVNACGTKGNRCNSCAAGNQCVAGNCSASSGAGGGNSIASGGGSSAAQGGGTATQSGGSGSAAGGTAGGFAGGISDCAVGAELIYTVDQNNQFSSFDPRLLPNNAFTTIGTLNCPAAAGDTPYSMSVDRNAIAWVIYDSGTLFRVEIAQNLRCTKTTFAAQMGVKRFGMGFVSDVPMGQNETLFIAGTSTDGGISISQFGTLSTSAPYLMSLKATLTGSPELTGTGLATLWGFFPNLTPPLVAQIDKTTGANLVSYTAAPLNGDPRAWAFAFWGGDFFIFLKRATDTSTTVWRMNGQTHAVTAAIPNSGKTIVGAGVSTCAPVELM
jgi:hypothetical protein